MCATARRLTMQPLPGTEDAAQPFWSPDGQSLGFFAGGQLKKVSLSGGPPQTLAVAPVPRGGTWSRDGVILFVPFPEEPMQRIAASGGDAAALPLPAGELRWFPSFLPDGRTYLFTSRGTSIPGIGVGTIDSAIATEISPRGAGAIYAEPGYRADPRERSARRAAVRSCGHAARGRAVYPRRERRE